MPETIYLKKGSSEQNNVITLTPKKKTGIAAYREKKTIGGKIVKAATSLKTTAVLGSILGGLVTGGAAGGAAATASRSILKKAGTTALKAAVPKSVKGAVVRAVTIPTAIGVLSGSKKARETAKSIINPLENVKRGKKIGEIIEDPSKAKDVLGIKESSTLGEKVKAGLKTAGLVGGAAALGVGGVLAVKKAKEFITGKKQVELTPQTKQLGFTEPQPVGLGGVPIAVTQPISDSQPTSATLKQPPIQNIIQIQVQ